MARRQARQELSDNPTQKRLNRMGASHPGNGHNRFSAGTLVDAEQADVFKRGLPDGDNVIGERGLSAARWDVEHSRPNLFGTEERHERSHRDWA